MHLPLSVRNIYILEDIRVRYSYRRGLLRCLFNRFGQCEGLYKWNGNDDSSTLFFVHIVNLNNHLKSLKI